MSALAAAGYTTVALDEWAAGGLRAQANCFALSFDDGLRSIHLAADILARHGFQATAFLVTDRMGGDNAWPGQPREVPRLPLLSWREMGDLAAAGFRFGSHTRTHHRLNNCDDAALAAELAGSRVAIEDKTGQPCTLLAYPYGAASARVRAATSRHYAAALGTRLGYAEASEDRMCLSRIDAYYLRTPRALEAFIAGRWQRALWMRQRLRQARQAGRALVVACGRGENREGRVPHVAARSAS